MDNILKTSIQSAYYNVILQFFFRFFTFCLNIFLIRTIGKSCLGIVNVRLLLLESTLIFLSREPINRAALSAKFQKNSNDDDNKLKLKCTWPQVINQIWLTVPVCGVLTIPCLYIWLKILTPVDDEVSHQYVFSCIAVALSCIIQLLAELPSFICQILCKIKIKVFFDSLYLFVRSFGFVTLILWNYKDQSIYAFSIAQLLSSFVFVIGYYVYFYFFIKHSKDDNLPFQNITELLPGVLKNEKSIFNSELQTLTLSFVKQSILKQILTEGEKYVMSMTSLLSFSEQAVYDTVNNLGSLAARFIFRPIEDSSYFYFTRQLNRDVEFTKQDKEKITDSGLILNALCKTVLSVGLFAVIFAQSYSKIVLYLYGGEQFIADGLAENLLRFHSLAIVFLALNGITEGFMFATNSSTEINTYNYLMGFYSIIFLIFSYLLTRIYGPVGFILANIINMTCRIVYSARYIHKKFSPVNIYPIYNVLPKISLILLIMTGIICKQLENLYYDCCKIRFVIIGGVSVLLCLLCLIYENKNVIFAIRKMLNIKKTE